MLTADCEFVLDIILKRVYQYSHLIFELLELILRINKQV